MARTSKRWVACLIFLAIPTAAITADPSQPAPVVSSGLVGATVLIVRHAEKPSSGMGLTPVGIARSRAYVDYFRNFRIDGAPVHIDALVAAADSPHSQRSRLTLTPISAAMRIPIQQPFRDSEVAPLAAWIGAGPSHRTILIAWHHSEVPDLIAQLGVAPTSLLTFGRWPPSVYDWVVVIRYDANGKVIPAETKIVREDISNKDLHAAA